MAETDARKSPISAAVSVEVKKPVWQYLQQSSKYGHRLNKVVEDCGVDVAMSENQEDHLVLSGARSDACVEKAQEELSALIACCQQELKEEVMPLPESDEVLNDLDKFNTGALVYRKDNEICIIGNEEEVELCAVRMRELCQVGKSDSKTESGSLQVEMDLWKYMEKNNNYADDVRRLKEDMHVEVIESPDAPSIVRVESNGSGDDVAETMKAVNELVDRCRSSASTVRVPCNDNKIFAKAVKLLKTVNKSQGFVSAADNTIFVTGNAAEVADCIAKLEKLGVACNASPDVSSSSSRGDRRADDAAGGSTATDAADDSTSGTNTLDVEVDLWRYMEKSTNYADEIRRIKESMHVEVVESSADQQEASSTSTHLVFNGSDKDVALAVKAAKAAVESCRQQTSTVRVPCRDSSILSKISKLLKTVNKGQGFVSVANDTVSVTGSKSQVTESLEKLKKLGLETESPAPTPSDNAAGAADVSGGERSQPLDHSANAADLYGGGGFGGDYFGGFETSAEIPVDRRCWNFIEKRRQDKLLDLQNSLGVKVSSYPGQDNIAMVLLEAESSDMLECSRDAFAALVNQLERTIVIAALETNVGGEIPRDMQKMLEPLAEGTDAILEFAGSRLLMIGPQDGARDCQQRIVQALQQMSGGGGSTRDPRSMMGMRQGGGMGNPGSSRMGGGMSGSMGMMGGHPNAGMYDPGNDFGGGDPYSGAGGMGGQYGGAGGMGGQYGDMGDDMTGFGQQSRDQFQSIGGSSDAGFGDRSDMGGPSMADEEDDMEDDSEFYAMITGKKQVDEATLTRAASGSRQTSGARASAGRNSGQSAASSTVGSRGSTQNGNILDRSTPSFMGAPSSARTSSAGAASFGAGGMPGGRGTGGGGTSTGRAADAGSGRDDERKTKAGSRAEETKSDNSYRDSCSTEACTVCQSGPHHFSVGKKCPHAFCTTCVQAYFSSGELECPVCGVKNDVIDHKFTQPPGGRMLITYDNKNKLPGFDTSQGTIVITYTFPAGMQTDDMANPGRRYSTLTKTAFFPNTPDGARVVEHIEQAFEARLLFTSKISSTAGVDDELVWNGICHKTAVFGGPKHQ